MFADETRLDGPINDIIAGPATLGDAKAAATVLLVEPDAESRVDGVRDLFEAVRPDTGFLAGASAFDGLLTARLVAPDAQGLRAGLMPLISARVVSTPVRIAASRA